MRERARFLDLDPGFEIGADFEHCLEQFLVPGVGVFEGHATGLSRFFVKNETFRDWRIVKVKTHRLLAVRKVFDAMQSFLVIDRNHVTVDCVNCRNHF